MPVSYLPAATAAARGWIETGSNTRGWIVKAGGGACTHAQSGLGVLPEGCMKSSDLPICLNCMSLLSPSIFVSLSIYFSDASSLHSSLSLFPSPSFLLQGQMKKGGRKRFTERERVTVNVGPEQIAQAAKHSLLGSTLTSIWGSLRVFCSSMWQLGRQIKLGKAGGGANLLAAISRHTNTHKNALFSFLQIPYGACTDPAAAC